MMSTQSRQSRAESRAIVACAAGRWRARRYGMELPSLFPMIVDRFYRFEPRDSFFGELVRNASDALRRVQHAALSDPTVLDSDPRLEVRRTF